MAPPLKKKKREKNSLPSPSSINSMAPPRKRKKRDNNSLPSHSSINPMAPPPRTKKKREKNSFPSPPSINSMAPPRKTKREKNSLSSYRRPSMAPPTTRKCKKCKEREKRQKERERLEENCLPLLPCIPEHVIFSRILPFISFNNLAKLKPVCKSWCSFISSNPMLPFDRFLRHVNVSSSSYSGVIFPECNSDGQLVFFPTMSRGNGPFDVVSDFLSVSFSQQPCKELIASTDGLLCLKCSGGNGDNIIYVCNPLTKEGHVIPLSNSWNNTPDNIYVWRSFIGLAYDSVKSPAQYKLVCPWSHYFKEEERLVFGFEIFSSQTNEWYKSYNKYYVEEERDYDYLLNIFGRPHEDFPAMKSTYAGGVLYWDCCYFFMYFDPEKGYGGTVPLPFHGYEDETDNYVIGEFKGHVTCSRVSRPRGVQLWIMDVNRSTEWELMHQVSFEMVIQTNPLWNRKEVEIMFNGFYTVRALPFGNNGGRLFMRVPLVRDDQDYVLCYDLNSGKLNKFFTPLPATYYYLIENRHSFQYRSSMVSLPKLGKPS